jgi:uncharacterized protein (TIGR03437 family)
VPLWGQGLFDQRRGFEENRGQYRQEVRYVRRPSLYFTSNAVGFSSNQIALQFEGANSASTLRPADTLPGVVNIYSGNDPAKWIKGMPRYATLQMAGIYDGMDAAFLDNGALSCRITLAPGASVANLSVRVTGVTDLTVLLADGSLFLRITRDLSMSLPALQAHQDSPSGPTPVTAQYAVTDSSHFGIALGDHEASLPVVIDLALPGGFATPRQGTVAPSSLFYLAGSISRVLTEQPSADACRTDTLGRQVPCVDAILATYSPTLNLAGISYLQGSGDQTVTMVTAAARAGSSLSPPAEDIFVAGTTSSPDFPTTVGALQRTFGGGAGVPSGDIFVARFDQSGSLAYSTFLGGSQADDLVDLHASPTGDGSVYVTGSGAGLPPTAGAYLASGVAFAAKIDPQGSKLLYLSYLPRFPFAVDIGRDGGYYFASAAPPGFPTTPGAYQTRTSADWSAVVAKLNPAGTALEYGTYYADMASFSIDGIAVDSSGNAWFLGESNFGGYIQCCFLAKIDAAGSKVLYAGPFIDQGQYIPEIFVDRDQLVGYSPTVPIAGGPLGVSCGGGYATRLDSGGNVVLSKATPWTGVPLGLDVAGNLNLLNLATNGVDIEIRKVDVTPSLQASAMCVLNAASFQRPRAVAPGEIVTIFGSGLGPATGVSFQLDSQQHVPTSVAGTRVLYNGAPGPVLYAQDHQVNAIVPFSVQAGTSLTVEVEYLGRKQPGLTTAVTATQPDFFTGNSSGSGSAVAFNQNGTPNSDANSAHAGEIVTVFVTGLGVTVPASVAGEVASSIQVTPAANVRITAGNLPVELVYIGPSPGSLTSVTQVNFRVPLLALDPGFPHCALVIENDEWSLRTPVFIAVQ